MGLYTEYLSIDDYCKGESNEDCLYLNTQEKPLSFSEVINAAKSHFGDSFNMDDYMIAAEYNQFRCHGYDLIDFADYANLVCISKK